MLSIASTLAALCTSQRKLYSHTYEVDGYELGFGRAGRYAGHSHLYFYDIVFAPDGCVLLEPDNDNVRRGGLLVCPPRSWLPDVQLGDFFFMKFCPTPGHITVPEKVNTRLDQSPLRLHTSAVTITLSWYPKPDEARAITYTLSADRLEVNLQDRPSFTVVR